MTGVIAALGSMSGLQVNISNQSITKTGAGTQTVSYRLNSSGIAEQSKNGAYTTLETWLYSGAASTYEVRATLSSGDALSSGTLGTWQGLGTSREWTQQATAGNSFTSNLLIEIRLAASPFTVLDSASVTLNVNAS